MAAHQQITRAQFRQQVKNSLQSAPFWSDTELNGLINQALRTFNCFTGYWRKRVTVTTQQGNPYINLPVTLTCGMRVQLGSTALAQGSVFDWDQGWPDWEGEPGDPEEWTPVGLSLIALRPPDARGNRQLAIDGVMPAPVMTADVDGSGNLVYIDLGQEQFDGLLDYIQHLASFKEGGQEFASSQELYKNFIAMCGETSSAFKASSLYRRIMGLDADAANGLKPRRATQQVAPKEGMK